MSFLEWAQWMGAKGVSSWDVTAYEIWRNKKKKHFLVHNEGSRGITDRWLPGTSHFLTLSVLEELEIQPETVCNSPLNLCNHVEEDTDGMATADGVAKLFEVVGKACWIHPLNDWHTSLVQGLEREKEMWEVGCGLFCYLDRLVDLSFRGIIVGVVEPVSPVTKVWRDDKTHRGVLIVKTWHLMWRCQPRWSPGDILQISCHISPPS